MAKRKKSPGKTPVKNKGELVPQPHGGALRRGSRKGNTPGTGRPPSVIREQLRGSFADRIAILEAIASGEAVEKVRFPDGTESEVMKSASVSDRLKALDLLAKYGLGTKQEVTGEDGEAIQVAHMAVHFVRPADGED